MKSKKEVSKKRSRDNMSGLNQSSESRGKKSKRVVDITECDETEILQNDSSSSSGNSKRPVVIIE